MSTPPSWSRHLQQCVLDACLLEVRSAKPGNVTPDQSFADMSVADFERSAQAVSAVLQDADRQSVGTSILRSIQATRQVVDSNTNLGIVLLLAPLASVPEEQSLSNGILPVLEALSVQDAKDAFEAIRLASPAGLGEAESQDVAQAPTETLRQCMLLAADRDLIARQYHDGFQGVLHQGLGWLQETASWRDNQPLRVAFVALQLMQQSGDSLIARKVGEQASRDVARRAAEVLASDWPSGEFGRNLFAEFDAYLRSDGNRLNPGTTADMIAAILFAALRDRLIIPTAQSTSFRFVDQDAA
ncbi:MAG: triphosphoribosyl-dephospho-CoA synthase [Planctomycetaceae bacterium]|nr:triphosphoribosyl-dephospho-CoA synthase [Planctomycetaceae bacterium]